MNAPPPFGYYAPPETGSGRLPPVIILYRLYAVVMTLVYGVILASMISLNERTEDDVGRDVVYLIIGVAGILTALHAVATFVPRRPWGWMFAVLVLSVGAMSCGTALAIPLLVFWLRPECKAAFRRFL